MSVYKGYYPDVTSPVLGVTIKGSDHNQITYAQINRFLFATDEYITSFGRNGVITNRKTGEPSAPEDRALVFCFLNDAVEGAKNDMERDCWDAFLDELRAMHKPLKALPVQSVLSRLPHQARLPVCPISTFPGFCGDAKVGATIDDIVHDLEVMGEFFPSGAWSCDVWDRSLYQEGAKNFIHFDVLCGIAVPTFNVEAKEPPPVVYTFNKHEYRTVSMKQLRTFGAIITSTAAKMAVHPDFAAISYQLKVLAAI